MLIRKTLSILGLMIAFAAFNEPVQIPRKTLLAGSYWIQLLRNVGNTGIVQILNEKHEFIATLFTVPRERREATGQSAFVLANEGEGKVEAIVAWFYPGRTNGHEFVYPKPKRQELARGKTQTVVAGN